MLALKTADVEEAIGMGDGFQAVHLEGGNFYDNQLIDIRRSHETLKNLVVEKISIRRPFFFNLLSFSINAVLQKMKWHEFFLVTGMKKEWFNGFSEYWYEVLGGRPIITQDFLMLQHDYRKRQLNRELIWGSAQQHIDNWQQPYGIYFIFSLYRKHAIAPIVGVHLWNKVKKGASILEYGCALAPFYNCYRNFFSHLDCVWTLADIPNFPFHFSKYLYRHDDNLHFHTIHADKFRDPLESESCYDIIILTTVLEHLDDPVFVADYLLSRLNKGGLFIFDYVISEGIGFDTPSSLAMRTKCLENILAQVEIIHGSVDVNKNVGLVIARRK